MAASKKSISVSSIIFYAFALLVFGAVVYYFSEIRKDIKLFETVTVYWLLLAFAGQVLTYLFGALVYRKLLSVFEHQSGITTWQFFQASIVALFFNQTVPSAGVSGNTFFFNFLLQRNIAVTNILTLIFTELISFYVAIEVLLVLLLILSLLFFSLASSFYIVLIAGMIVYAAFAMGIGLLGRGSTVSRLYKRLEKIKWINKYLNRLQKSVAEKIKLNELETPWNFFKTQTKTAFEIVLYQVAIFAADAFTILSLFYGLGIHVSIGTVCTAFLLTKIISLLPVSPGALILYESSMTFFLVKLGTPIGPSIIVTLLYRALSFWLPILVGFLLYKKLKEEKTSS